MDEERNRDGQHQVLLERNEEIKIDDEEPNDEMFEERLKDIDEVEESNDNSRSIYRYVFPDQKMSPFTQQGVRKGPPQKRIFLSILGEQEEVPELEPRFLGLKELKEGKIWSSSSFVNPDTSS